MLNSGMSWREVTVEKIAEAAGIKRTLFYVYYPDRAAVLIRLGEQLVDSTVTAISDHFLVAADGSDGVREELLRFIEMMRRYRPVTKALMEGSGVDESVEKFWRGLVNTFVEPTTKWIEDLQKNAGASQAVNPAMTAFCLVIMTGRVALHPLAEDPATKDDLFEAVVGIWTNALYAS
jgi:AcrR family transcriptional regulator